MESIKTSLNSIQSHIEARDLIITELRRELVGPAPDGKPLRTEGLVEFRNDQEAFANPWYEETTGEEILVRVRPSERYGVGILFAYGENNRISSDMTLDNVIPAEVQIGPDPEIKKEISSELQDALEEIRDRGTPQQQILSEEESRLTTNVTPRPSSMAVSFMIDLDDYPTLYVEAFGGRYHKIKVKYGDKQVDWYRRQPIRIEVVYDERLLHNVGLLRATNPVSENLDGFNLDIELYSRIYRNDRRKRIVTVTLINRTDASTFDEEYTLFQAGFRVFAHDKNGRGCIPPYPEESDELIKQFDDEESSIALLYRDMKTFAIGHGCSAEWGNIIEERASEIKAEVLPSVEVPSVTPDLKDVSGELITSSMIILAGQVDGEDGFSELQEVINGYEEWILEQDQRRILLKPRYQDAAENNLLICRQAVERMKEGFSLLKEDGQMREAFRLANHAIMLQQILPKDIRKFQYDEKTKRTYLEPAYGAPDIKSVGKGQWRPFQIAFILQCLSSFASGSNPNREIVDLLWFPTGGGKTEAYLGLTAIAIFLRRLRNPHDVGTTVITRYTLRLLTTQQFERASRLVCAMEILRKANPKSLGETPISIGIWVGGENTPNTSKKAKEALDNLLKDPKSNNPFLLNRCPWCGAQMGPRDLPSNAPKTLSKIVGYKQRAQTVRLECPDQKCPFNTGLPIEVIDESIYESRPDLIIATIDKFAQVTRFPQIRYLFGLNDAGERVYSPPSLILQDELHLISGPLGSLAGLYETLIHHLCTDFRHAQPIVPKIICATATTRRYREQILGLYARNKAELFPPPGLDANDSYFARYATNEDGTLKRGRVYVGVLAPALWSLQGAQVRTYASLLQSVMNLPEHLRNPWWTLLLYFNSLRELGTTLSLLEFNIPDYLDAVKNRYRLEFADMRSLRRVLELTSRLKNSEVPQAIRALEIEYKQKGTVDVCLASNIIEVGVDISRLSVMAVTSQPKNTAQYIQVTGRVGREWWECPGLVVDIFSPTRPRDRSHYEKFRSYHERLYAQVEPISVTPFAPPVLERALHAIMVGFVLQTGSKSQIEAPSPYPNELLEKLRLILSDRVNMVDAGEKNKLKQFYDHRVKQWKTWERSAWRSNAEGSIPLLIDSGSYIQRDWIDQCWQIPNSLRNVDANCQVEITNTYNNVIVAEDIYEE